jgi:hypothetical protein
VVLLDNEAVAYAPRLRHMQVNITAPEVRIIMIKFIVIIGKGGDLSRDILGLVSPGSQFQSGVKFS